MNIVQEGVSITLKDITDLIDVRHNDAIKKVEKLSNEPSFGPLRKTRISHAKGKEIDTFLLSSKQAIAVAAKLNNAMLMKVIDRIEELEIANRKNVQPKLPTKPMEVLKLVFGAMEEQDARITKLENTSTIDSGQQRKIQIAVARRVEELRDQHKIEKEFKPKLFSRMHRMIKREFDVPSYKDVPKIRFDEAISKINGCSFGGVL